MHTIFKCIKYCFFLRILENLPHLPRQHLAAIGCTKNYQPIEGYNCIALRVLKVSYSDVGEGGVALNCDKLKQLIRQGLRNTLYSLQAHGWVHAVDQCVFCASPFMSRTECSNHEKAKCLNHQNICYRVGHGCCRIQQYIW